MLLKAATSYDYYPSNSEKKHLFTLNSSGFQVKFEDFGLYLPFFAAAYGSATPKSSMCLAKSHQAPPV